MSNDIMDQVISAITSLGVPFRIDEKIHSIAHANIIKKENEIIILTSKKAMATYDSIHPERITCIVIFKDSYRIIVNDREYDVVANIKFAYNATYDFSKCECVVCFRKVKTFAMCHGCHGILCVKCNDKLTIDSAIQCPVCRLWILSGDGFGRPFKTKMVIENNDLKSASKLSSILNNIDGGEINIMLRVNHEFIYNQSLTMNKLVGTDRYSKTNMEYKSVPKIREKLNKWIGRWLETTPDIMIYVVRKTYGIDKEFSKPIVEQSVFRVKHDILYQLSVDACFKLDFSENSVVKLVEYIEPSEYSIPKCVQDMFDFVNTYKCDKTISFVCIGTHIRFNFDIDNEGNISTMHYMRMCALVDNAFGFAKSAKKPMHAICRFFGKPNVCLITSYKFDGILSLQMDKCECKKMVDANVDDLLDSENMPCEFM